MNNAQYLKELGIPIYVPRNYNCEKSSHYQESNPPSQSNNPYLIFLIHPNESQHPLLQKILGAVGLPLEAISICFSHTIPSQIKHLIAFGKNLTTIPQAIHTLSLDELATNDTAKRALWQQLKSIKAAYGN